MIGLTYHVDFQMKILLIERPPARKCHLYMIGLTYHVDFQTKILLIERPPARKCHL